MSGCQVEDWARMTTEMFLISFWDNENVLKRIMVIGIQHYQKKKKCLTSKWAAVLWESAVPLGVFRYG